MILERRAFLRMLGITAGAAGAGGCQFWSLPDDLVALAARGPGLESFANTICGMCASGCGITARLVDGLPVGLKGNSHTPLNRGGLCPVGNAGLDVLYSPARLQSPMRRAAGGDLVPTTWDEALGEIAARLNELRANGQASRIALLTGEPGALFHDLARQFVHALGSTNVARPDDDARLAYRFTQGLDSAPGFDLARADMVLSFGLDLYEDGPVPVHAISALIGSREGDELASIVYVGTRLSATASKAAERVAVLPGTYAAFALGVAHVLVREGRFDARFVAERTHGFEPWTDATGRSHDGFRRMVLEDYYPDRAAMLCGCDPAVIIRVARRFAAASAPLAMSGGDALHASNGTWTAMAVHALNALAGAFDRPGGVVVPTPIPLNPLPHVEPPAGVSVFSMPAADDVLSSDPLEALASAILDRAEPVEVLLLLSANPAFECAAGERVQEALRRIPLVVGMFPFVNETAALAHVLLPTPTFLEGWQATTTPATVGFSSLGVAAPVMSSLYGTRHPADILLGLARRAGDQASAPLPWQSWDEYLQDRVGGIALSGEGAIVTGSFEESWTHYLEERGWRFQEHRNAEDYWRDLVNHAGWWNPVQVAGDWSRVFPTPSGRFEFYSTELEARLRDLGGRTAGVDPRSPEALRAGLDALGLTADESVACMPHFEPPRLAGDGALTLIPFNPLTARGPFGVWSPMVLEMFGHSLLSGWETWVELHPDLARELELGDGDRVAVESSEGAIETIVRVRPGGSPETVHVPLGLGHTAPGPASGIGSNPLALLAPVYDPLSGSRSLTGTRVRLRLLSRRAHGGPAPVHGEMGR